MVDNVTSWFRSLPSEMQSRIKTAALMLLIVAGCTVFWAMAGSSDSDEGSVVSKHTAISLGDDLVEDDLRKQIEADRSQQEETNRVLTDQIQSIGNTLDELALITSNLKSEKDDPEESFPKPEPVGNKEDTKSNSISYPPSPNTNYVPPPISSASSFPSRSVGGEYIPQESVQHSAFIGGIVMIEGAEQPKHVEKKKSTTGLYMSPGFMEGMLLTGLKAETVEGANENPEPMIIRVQAPAVLPNSVKANLRGCFVIAHGFGKLNKERIEARLVSLHCLNRDQQAVIDESIKGFIVDSDGSKGISGRVVIKAGANTARMFIAGMLSGFGQGIESANTNSSINPIGGTIESSSESTSQSLRRGFGRGVSDGAEKMSDIFLNLVQQSSPIIEVGPAKKITLALTEGVYLNIRDIKDFEG